MNARVAVTLRQQLYPAVSLQPKRAQPQGCHKVPLAHVAGS